MRKHIVKKRFSYLLFAIATALAAAGASTLPADTDGFLTVTFIDVGQGDSTLITTPEGTTLLIDGGEHTAYEEHLRPFLVGTGVTEIDYALASHYHSDHIGGISELLERGMVNTLIIPEYDDKNQTRERLIKKANQNSVKTSEVSAGDTIDLNNPDLKISVLHPEHGGFSPDNENSNSLLLRLEYFGEVFLFTGDMEEDAEAALLGKYDLEADVLKVGHHGSYSSTSEKFLAEVDPTYAVIEVGKGNRYGHPHYEVVERLENNDIRIYRTDDDGCITFKLSDKGIQTIQTERGTLTNGS